MLYRKELPAAVSKRFDKATNLFIFNNTGEITSRSMLMELSSRFGGILTGRARIGAADDGSCASQGDAEGPDGDPDELPPREDIAVKTAAERWNEYIGISTIEIKNQG